MSHQVTIGNKKDDFLNIMSQDPEAILILLLILKKKIFYEMLFSIFRLFCNNQRILSVQLC